MSAPAPNLSDWSVGELQTSNGHTLTVDLRPIVWPGCSAIDIRAFRRMETHSWSIDADRVSVLITMVHEIRGWALSPSSKFEAARSLKRFVRWADQSDEPLSRNNIVPLLARYDRDSSHRIFELRRAACGLDLSLGEREQLFPPEDSAIREDDWRYLNEVEGSGTLEADFARLLAPGDAALPLHQWRRVRESRITMIDTRSPRSRLVIALRDAFRARRTEKSLSASSLSTLWSKLRQWWVWVDEQGLPLDQDHAIVALQRYAIHSTQQWQAGRFKAKTVRTMVDPPMRLIAMALDKPAHEIKLKLQMPGLKESGLTTPMPEKAALKVFCANLHELIRTLTPSLIRAWHETPAMVKLWDDEGKQREMELPAPYGGYGGGIDPQAANLELLRLRIWAECNRFIAITGCNLSVTRSITISEWSDDEPIWKGRAAKYVDPRVSKMYSRHLKQHIAFLDACLPGGVSRDTRLFPGVATTTRSSRQIVARSRAGTLTWRIGPWRAPSSTPLISWLTTADLCTFGSRQLRRAKADWLLDRYNGDPLPVSRDLGNSPEVTTRSYGGKGNLQRAGPEWSGYWSSAEQATALAPGRCASPGDYAPIAEQSSDEGCSEGACFGCAHYRGENSLDYIHRILTYQAVLSLRAPTNSECDVAIYLVDEIVEDHLTEHPDQQVDAQQLREGIFDNPHPRFAPLLRIQMQLWR